MPRSYEELTQQVLTLVAADRTVQWGVADAAREALDELGLTARQVATDWGFSASTVRKLRRVAQCFPDVGQRWPDVPFSIYVMATATPDPATWVQRAAQAQWSTRDLRDAIRAVHAADPDALWQQRAEQTVQRLRRVGQEAPPAVRAYLRTALQSWLQEMPHGAGL
jgi:hypothetical protein